jgi:hypothetical protein
MAVPAQAVEGTPPSPAPAPDTPSTQGDAVPAKPVYGKTYRVIDVTSQAWIDYTQPIGSCSASNGTCTIAKGRSATTTTDVSTGITRDTIAASLGISASWSVSIDVSCTSPVLKPGQTWTAFPRGTRYDYAILMTSNIPGQEGSGISAYGKAFKANPNDIVCQIR